MVAGGMHGSGGSCVVARGHAWLPGGAWLLGGVHGSGGHAWLPGGIHGCWGHAWLPVGGMHRILRDTVNERAVRILLECILVSLMFVAVQCEH